MEDVHVQTLAEAAFRRCGELTGRRRPRTTVMRMAVEPSEPPGASVCIEGEAELFWNVAHHKC